MNTFKCLSLAAAVAVIGFTAAVPQAQAEVGIGIGIDIGAAPVCPYGYYDYAPYACAPYGFYGPQWFVGGVFIGAGPWFRGHDDFRGEVNHLLDASRGYRGPLPERGETPHPWNSLDRMDHFNGTEMRDGLGHAFAHEGGGRR